VSKNGSLKEGTTICHQTRKNLLNSMIVAADIILAKHFQAQFHTTILGTTIESTNVRLINKIDAGIRMQCLEKAH
jgi:hypothetical protein